MVGLRTPGSGERAVRQNVATLYTLFRKTRRNVQMQIVRGASWQFALQRCVVRNDLVVCPSGETEAAGAFQVEALSRALLRTLNLPVLEIAGAYPPLFDRIIRRILRLIFEIFPYVTVGAFFWVQYHIQSTTNGITTMVDLALSVIAELALVFIWSLFLD